MGARRIYENAMKALAALAMLATLAAQETAPRATAADFAAVDAAPADQAAFDRLIEGLPKVRFDDEGTPRTLYVWEGDMLLNAEEIRAIIFSRRAGFTPARGASELLLQLRADGKPGFWKRGARTLTYAIDCATFVDSAQCGVARRLMTRAARDWAVACTNCGIVFREVTATTGVKPRDGTGPTFVVRYEPDQFDYLAIAFFANDPAFKRYLSVTPGFFQTSFDQTGILRHELGHVLGYRHEHNRALSGCSFEDRSWVALTPYDPKSVMHYFCGGGGTKALQISATDVAGHRALYRAR